MKDQRKSEIKVGITTLIGITIFIIILGWAKNFSLAANEKKVAIQFENVDGLEIGDNVTINGVRKGFVEDVVINSQGVRVLVSLDKDTELKEDAKFALTMLDLMGGKKIDIAPGRSSKPLDYNKTYNGVFYADIPAVMSSLGGMQDKITNIVSEVNKSLIALNGYLTDKNMEDNVKTTVANLSVLTNKLNAVVDENRNGVNKLTNNAVQLTEDAKEFVNTNKQDIQHSLKDLQSLLKESEAMIKKVNSLIDETSNKQNNVGKLLYDDQVIEDLKTSLKQVKELTNTLNEQLNKKGLNVDAHIKLF